jgi:hypothetical protein
MPKCYEYVYFLRFHEIVLMYSYNLSITGWVPNLRESSHGHCVRFDVLFIPEKGGVVGLDCLLLKPSIGK